jgi:uncharacterized protein with NRDE domain
MCLLVFAWKTNPDYPMLFAGNRDELHVRPALPAGFWEETPQLIGGRDLQAGGTWLGVTTCGRFAVVTNYRVGLNPKKAARSRGDLTAEFLRGQAPAEIYINEIAGRAGEYGAFSLIVGDRRSLWYLSNHGRPQPREVTPGIHGLSNHLLDTPWPKVTQSVARLALLLEQHATSDENLFALLADRTPAPEAQLPETGIGREHERQVSPVFVVNPVYGTRCSSVICLHADGHIRFMERRFDADGDALETRGFHVSRNPP